MALNTVTRVQDPRSASIDAIVPKNWHKYPPKVADMTKSDAAAKVVTYTGGVANQGSNAGNDGEVGTINSTSPTRGVAWNTQGEKETVLGMPIAFDITKSYGTNARGPLAPRDPYPTGLAAPTDVTLTPATVLNTAAISTVVGTLATVDPNVGDTFTYTFVSNPGGLFKIVANAVQTAVTPLGGAGTKPITVRSTDQWGKYFDKALTITVT
jgi:hypothetical protein